MYQRVIQSPFVKQTDAFERHLTDLAQYYSIVVPGDQLNKHQVNICLTFDDAYFDFYHCVFPLLQKLNIRALLAIPSGLILDDTTLTDEDRLNVPYKQALGAFQTHATLCTWREINEMVSTDLVVPASHGLTHQRLTLLNQQSEHEIVYSKQLLQEKTQREINTFVYPYGKMTRSVNRFVNRHYNYAMRIGSALNWNWSNMHNVVYRINAEEFWPQEKPLFTPMDKISLWSRFLSNTVRFK